MKPDWVSAWSGVVSAIATAVLAGLTLWLGRLTKVLADETRAARRAAEKADVQCAAQLHEEHVELVEVVVTNLGPGVASTISVTVDPVIAVNDGTEQGPMTFHFARLLPGAKFRIAVGLTLQLKNRAISARGCFVDVHGQHSIDYTQAMSGWWGAARASDQPQYKTAKALAEIAETVGRWSHTGRVNVDVFTSQDRVEEREADERRVVRLQGGQRSSPEAGATSEDGEV